MSDEITAFNEWQQRYAASQHLLSGLLEIQIQIKEQERRVNEFLGLPPSHPAMLFEKLADMALTDNTLAILHSAGVFTLGDLIQRTVTQLLREPMFGRKQLNEIKQLLAELGNLELGAKLENWPPPDLLKD